MSELDQMADALLGTDEPEQEAPEDEQTDTPPTGAPEPSTEPAEGEEGPAGGDEDDAPETWADALGIDEDDLIVTPAGKLEGVRVKVDGEESVVSLSELRAGYQKSAAVTQRFQALAEEKKQFDGVRLQAAAEYQQRIDLSTRLLKVQEQALLGEFQRIPWDQLRAQNPGEYAAMLKDFEGRKAQLASLEQALVEEQNTLAQEQQQQQQQQFRQFLVSQYQEVMARNPEWQDQKRMQADIRNMAEFAREAYGISEQEFAYLNDARHIEVLKDAMKYRKGAQIAEDKIVRKATPKFLKSGGTKKPMPKSTQLALNARKQTNSSTRKSMENDAIASLLLGN